MTERIRVSISARVEAVELAARDAGYRNFLIEKAEKAMNEKARERGRKISERPSLVDITQSPLVESVIYFEFEANTQPI